MKKVIIAAIAALMIGIFSLPQIASAQNNSPVYTELERTIYSIETPEYRTGSPFLTEEIKRKLDWIFNQLEDEYGDLSHQEIAIYGKTNFENWSKSCKSNSRFGGNANFPHAITNSASLKDCSDVLEVDLGLKRAQLVYNYALEQGYIDGHSATPFAYGAVDQKNDGEATPKMIDIVVQQHQVDPDYIAMVDSRLENLEGRVGNLEDRVVVLEEELEVFKRDRGSDRVVVNNLDGGTDIGVTFGPQLRYFDEVAAPGIEAGITLNGDGVANFRFTGWAAYQSGAKEIELDRSDFNGTHDLNRLAYGLRAAWHPLETEYISLGPAIGWSHSEDILDQTSKHTRKLDALDVGISLDIAATNWLHINGYGGYTPIAKEAIDGDFVRQSATKGFSGSIGISLNF